MKQRYGLLLIATLTAAFISTAVAGQPKMDEALEHLRKARAALIEAKSNKEGHRKAAIEYVEKAIAEVEKGKKAAD